MDSLCQKCKSPLWVDAAYLSGVNYASTGNNKRVQFPSGAAGTGAPSRNVVMNNASSSHSGGLEESSFIVLTESLMLNAPSGVVAVPAAATEVVSEEKQLEVLRSVLDGTHTIHFPLCTECTEVLLTLVSSEIEDLKKLKEKYVSFEKEVRKRRESGIGTNAETLGREIQRLLNAQKQATAELEAARLERQQLEDELRELEKEEAELDAEEITLWKEYNSHLEKERKTNEEAKQVACSIAHDKRILAMLQRTNVYNDAFCIGQDANFATINGLRFGRLPNAPVDWTEINAAWGCTLSLLHVIARRFHFHFREYKLVPLGSFSRIEHNVDGRKTSYDLYVSGDFSLTRLWHNHKYDTAMVAFLECLDELGEHIEQIIPDVNLPHTIEKDKIGDASIKLQFSNEQTWTRALRHVLGNLKRLLAYASE